MARARKRKSARRRMSGARVFMTAVLLVAVLLAWSYGSTAWERARESGTSLWAELSLAFEQIEIPLLLEAATVSQTVQAAAVQQTAVPMTAEPVTVAPTATPTPVPASADAAPRAALVAAATSLPLLVNAQNPVADDYVPGNLVAMREACPSNIVTIKGSEIQGERTAVEALIEMFTQAIAQGQGSWQVSAGYRSVAYQKSLFDDQVYTYRKESGMSREQAIAATKRYVAEPGASEHHTGLAFDITVPGESFRLTSQSKWLAENCWEYGFILRYTEEKEAITGIAAEPWHIRYVGQPHAQIMRENNWCLEEYIEANKAR